MTKETEQQKKYMQPALPLSLKLTTLAKRVFANWEKSLVVLQVALPNIDHHFMMTKL